MVETGGWGGIAHYAWDLCAALAGAGVEVSLLTNRQWELAHLPARFEVDRCFAGDAGYLGNVKALRQALARWRRDVVHVQSLLSTRLDAFLWPLIRRRRPVVMTAHNIRSHERIRWDDWTLWRCLAAADAVVVHTRRAEEVARRRLRAGARIELIHLGSAGFLGAEDRPDRGGARARLGLPREGKIVLAFGAIRPYKGLHGAIAALAELRRRRVDARLVIAGPLLVGSEAEYQDSAFRNLKCRRIQVDECWQYVYCKQRNVTPKIATRQIAGDTWLWVAIDAETKLVPSWYVGQRDAVAATEVLEHLDEPGRMLAEARRVLRPAGRFFMTTPNSGALPYRILRFLPDSTVARLAASLTQETLHPELLHDHATAACSSGDPDRHRREGFTLQELGRLAAQAGLRMAGAYTYRIPIPDRVMQVTPRTLSRSVATLGTRPLPLGLQLYAEFTKT